MHVLFVTGEYPPMQGGVGAYTQELARALCALGFQVTVLTSEKAASPDPRTRSDGVRVLPAIRHWDWSIWRLVDQMAKEVGADWVHVQYQTAAFDMHPAINFAPSRWRRRGRHVAWTYHDLLVPYLFPKAGERLRRWITERPARTANLTIVTNEGDRRQLALKAIPAHWIPIGSNIVGLSLKPAERLAWRQEHGYQADDLILSYFGFLNRSKGVIHLLQALAMVRMELPQARLLMIGDRVGASDPTNAWYAQEVEARIAALKLDSYVQWTGRQTNAGVASDLNACDVLALPFLDGASLRRGTLMAGLANGCAIVTTAPQAPLPELVDGEDLLYVPPGDDQALAAAILRLAGDPVLAHRLRTNARAKSELFTWPRIALAHAELYGAPADARLLAVGDCAGSPSGYDQAAGELGM